MNYFERIFTSSNPTSMENIFQAMKSKIGGDENANLLKEFTQEEIKVALDQMHPDKAPGPDGMTAGFYKKYWNVVGKVITSVILDFLNRGIDLRAINHTNVVLILKKKSPTSPMDFRPISLCNVIYKIIAKVLANRLKVVLPQIIDESQSAFVQG